MVRRPAKSYLHTAWLCTCVLVADAAVADSLPTVADLLQALVATGVEVLYSSELVPPSLEAPPSLPGSDPMSQVVQALAAHHLELRSAGPQRFFVTRAPTAPALHVAPAAPSEAALEEVSVFASRYAFTSGTDGESIDVDRRKMRS